MINYNGYYLEEPVEIYDGRSQIKSSFGISAFLFLMNGKVKIAKKHEYLNDLQDFSKNDFKTGCRMLDYSFNNQKVTIKTDSKFGKDFQISFDNNEEITISSTGAKLVFIPWKKVNDLNKSDLKHAQIIKEIFGPFDHKKYRIFYQ